MTPAEPSVTVCIVAGDLGEELLRLTLESVTAHTPPEVAVRILGGSARDRQRDAPRTGTSSWSKLAASSPPIGSTDCATRPYPMAMWRRLRPSRSTT